MKIPKIFLLVVLVLMPLTVEAFEIPVTTEACGDWTTDRWLKMLEKLKRLEIDFFERERYQLQLWETLYNPLWSAENKKKDAYSATRRAEGEMLAKRYTQASEDLLLLAEEADQNLSGEIKEIRNQLKGIPFGCDGSEFRMCMTPRREEIASSLDELEKFLAQRKTSELEFTSRMRAALQDKPSEHDALEDLYHERLEKWSVESRIRFLGMMRALREKLEVDWPGDRCCALCTGRVQNTSDDPVLRRVKPDPQGNLGVQGQVVNNASLTDAFERFDREKKKGGQSR